MYNTFSKYKAMVYLTTQPSLPGNKQIHKAQDMSSQAQYLIKLLDNSKFLSSLQ